MDYINKRSPISSAGSKFGLTAFSSPNKIHVEFSFGDYNNAQGNKNAIGRASYNPGNYNLPHQAQDVEISSY